MVICYSQGIMENQDKAIKVISNNRKAFFLYEILEKYEAGIELVGTEVKSIRAGKVNLTDGYAFIKNAEVWLSNVHISSYAASSLYFNHDPRRIRKLLMHRKEINQLIGKIKQKGLTLVPLKLYFKGSLVKISLGLGKGKKLHDKRETIKNRQDQREISRILKNN